LSWRGCAEEPDLGLVRAGLFHEFTDYYGATRDDVLPLIPDGVSEVLEIGCGRGRTGALLQDRLGCRVTGVELNPVIAEEAARRLHRVVCGDIEDLELTGEFDAVIATELFEHLVEPIGFLRTIRGLLRPGGTVVISTPNVGHYSLVRDLLHGRWDYLPVGLLCYTHLRFFTRSTITDLFDAAGFSRVSIEPQSGDVPDEFARWAEAQGGDLESLAATGFWVSAVR
jgi:SAM-dependent methyltransferase